MSASRVDLRRAARRPRTLHHLQVEAILDRRENGVQLAMQARQLLLIIGLERADHFHQQQEEPLRRAVDLRLSKVITAEYLNTKI